MEKAQIRHVEFRRRGMRKEWKERMEKYSITQTVASRELISSAHDSWESSSSTSSGPFTEDPSCIREREALRSRLCTVTISRFFFRRAIFWRRFSASKDRMRLTASSDSFFSVEISEFNWFIVSSCFDVYKKQRKIKMKKGVNQGQKTQVSDLQLKFDLHAWQPWNTGRETRRKTREIYI